MKPQTLFVNTILVAALVAAVLAVLSGTDLESSAGASAKADSAEAKSTEAKSTKPISDTSGSTSGSPKFRPPPVAEPLPAGSTEGASRPFRPPGTTQGVEEGLEGTGNSDISGSPNKNTSSSSEKPGQEQVKDVRERVSENLKETLGKRKQAQRGSLSVEAYNRKADSLRKTQQEHLESVIQGS